MIKAPVAALVIVVALLGGFYGGYKIGGGGTASAAAANGSTTGNGTNRGGGGFAAAACPSPGATPSPSQSGRVARRGTSGTVTNLTSSSMTVHDARCNTDVKVTFDSSVIVRKMVVGAAADLQENQTVTIVGTREADGTVKANTIQIVPAGTAGGGFGGGAAAGG